MPGLLTRVRSRLHAASSARELATHWQEKYERLRTQVKERAQRDHDERDILKSQSMRRARRMPSVDTLQHMLQVRTAVAQSRAARIRRAGIDPPPVHVDPSSVRQTRVDGLVWSVPALPSQSAASVDRMLAKQRFPYLAIAQTRDVSIGGVMLDIGANIGRMAIPRVILGDSTRAYCAEPDELNWQCLSANVRDNGLTGLVTADCVAISDRVGRLPLQRGKMSGAHRLVHSGTAPEDGSGVRCTTLDAWVAERAIDLSEVTFVKVDTQGSEVHVLAGASTVLEQPHIAWQIEVSPSHLRLAGHEPTVLYATLRDRFTHFYDLNPRVEGPKLRTTADLTSALDYLERSEEAQTDIVLYRAPARAGA